jgi:hypothetical protein
VPTGSSSAARRLPTTTDDASRSRSRARRCHVDRLRARRLCCGVVSCWVCLAVNLLTLIRVVVIMRLLSLFFYIMGLNLPFWRSMSLLYCCVLLFWASSVCTNMISRHTPVCCWRFSVIYYPCLMIYTFIFIINLLYYLSRSFLEFDFSCLAYYDIRPKILRDFKTLRESPAIFDHTSYNTLNMRNQMPLFQQVSDCIPGMHSST